MKARDELVKSTLRMTLTAIGNAEVAGTQARELDDAEVLKVIAKEAKKRAESAEAFAAAGRDELAAQERAEGEVLARYLPTQLTDDELAAIARTAVEDTAAELGEQPGPRQMGQVMKRANAAAAGRADGGRVAAAVKTLLVPDPEASPDRDRTALSSEPFLRTCRSFERLLGGRLLAGGGLAGGRLLRGRAAGPAVGQQLGGALVGERLDLVALAQRRVGLAVGDVRAEPAVLDHHRLAGGRVGAQLAQRRGGRRGAPAALLGLGVDLQRLVEGRP